MCWVRNRSDADKKRGQHKVACEIDFAVNKGNHRYYIQSALNIDHPEKAKAELRPLLNAKDFFKKIIVTKTAMKPWIDEHGIVHMGIYEFLLNDDSLNI